MELVFATHNANKLREVALLLPGNYQLLSLDSVGCTEEIPETAQTIEGNAILKANYVNEKYQKVCFADDTGLMVDALEGEPGVFSARYAGEHKSADDNIDKLLQELSGVKNRSAMFLTVIALKSNDGLHLFKGIVKGKITEAKTGKAGFGYDPVFLPDGHHKTFAQMNTSEKNTISHRGRAMAKLIQFLTSWDR